jgi:hypothetical protein
MPFSADDKEFFSKLRDDIHHTRQRRFQYQITKVTSLSSLVGIASLLVKGIPLTAFLYVIPFLAIAFDCFILGESFTLRRMANFIQTYKSDLPDAEFKWETFVRANPDKLSSIANFIVTVASFLGCFIILALSNPSQNWFSSPLNAMWFISLAVSLTLLRLVERSISKKKWV